VTSYFGSTRSALSRRDLTSKLVSSNSNVFALLLSIDTFLGSIANASSKDIVTVEWHQKPVTVIVTLVSTGTPLVGDKDMDYLHEEIIKMKSSAGSVT
jgi:hypothetical protein